MKLDLDLNYTLKKRVTGDTMPLSACAPAELLKMWEFNPNIQVNEEEWYAAQLLADFDHRVATSCKNTNVALSMFGNCHFHNGLYTKHNEIAIAKVSPGEIQDLAKRDTIRKFYFKTPKGITTVVRNANMDGWVQSKRNGHIITDKPVKSGGTSVRPRILPIFEVEWLDKGELFADIKKYDFDGDKILELLWKL